MNKMIFTLEHELNPLGHCVSIKNAVEKQDLHHCSFNLEGSLVLGCAFENWHNLLILLLFQTHVTSFILWNTI